jgi:DNA-binding transcriptional ArsR family regulator
MVPRSVFETQAELCHTMSHAIRVEIVHALRSGPMRVMDIVEATGHPQASISRHLRVLRMGGVVTAQRHAQEVIYQLANPKIASICDLMREVLAEEASRQVELARALGEDSSE